jgi:transposase
VKPLLTEQQWELIRALLPPPARTGRPRADDRKVLEGIPFVLRSGCRWRDLPQGFPHPTTCWRRLRRWQEEGVWVRTWQALLSTLDEQGRLDWDKALLDGTFIPATRGERR